jgi:hypothetical protein
VRRIKHCPGRRGTKLLLARAFDRAWARYYRPGRVTLPPEVARPALANHLVQMARNEIDDEDSLAASSRE